MAAEPIKENPADPGIQETREGALDATAGDAPLSQAIQEEKAGRLVTTPATTPDVAPVTTQTPEPAKSIAGPAYKGFDRVLAFFMLALVFFLGSFAVTNSDVLMHLATGRRISKRRRPGSTTRGCIRSFSISCSARRVKRAWWSCTR
jgi:hypothetical protein